MTAQREERGINPVERIYGLFEEITQFLQKQNQPSFLITTQEFFRKSLLVTAASYLESCLCDEIIKFAQEKTDDNTFIVNFIEKKAISRQYHTYFNWKQISPNSVNGFLGLFGDSYLQKVKAKIKGSVELSNAAKSFIELGSERNNLVHRNFGNYPLQKTAQEIYDMYLEAVKFVYLIPQEFRTD